MRTFVIIILSTLYHSLIEYSLFISLHALVYNYPEDGCRFFEWGKHRLSTISVMAKVHQSDSVTTNSNVQRGTKNLIYLIQFGKL